MSDYSSITPTNRSVFAADLVVTGEITSSGQVEVHGKVDGTLAAQGLLIGSEGAVKGTVSASNIEVMGKLEGRISTETFTLRSSAEVQADVTYVTSSIESGAAIEGRFTIAKKRA